jgi:zinc transporter 2
MLMSCGVITAAVVIYFNPVLWWFDPLCTYLFAGMVLCTSYPTLKNCFIIMMEGSPNSSVVDEVTADLLKMKNVISVHDVHFWQTS